MCIRDRMQVASKYLEEQIRQLTSPWVDGGDQGMMCWPTSPHGYISSPFGGRYHPISGKYQFHNAIDIAGFRPYWPLSGGGYTGTQAYVLAAESGKVIFSGVMLGPSYSENRSPQRDEYENPQFHGYGSYLMVDHNNGYVTVYAHCHSRLVAKGSNVVRGQVIATIGSTGTSTGPHLHFEVRRNGTNLNPLSFLN